MGSNWMPLSRHVLQGLPQRCSGLSALTITYRLIPDSDQRSRDETASRNVLRTRPTSSSLIEKTAPPLYD